MTTERTPVKSETKDTETTNQENNQHTIKLEDKILFPKEFNKTVYIRRIPIPGRLPGQNLDESKQKIGSGFKGSSVLRGLSFKEEIKYLKEIIGLSPESPNWEMTTKTYWANISKDVPKDGVILEVGLKYTSKEDYEYDQKEAPRDFNGTLTEHKGYPINMADYILWRYCLLYSRVANTPEDIGKSPKIEFYLFNKDKEIADKAKILNSKRKAQQVMWKRLSERDWVDYVLTVLMAQDKGQNKKDVRTLAAMSEEEKDIMLDELVTGNPSGFLAIAEDKNLEIKSFIELCIASGKLERIPNTDTITMDGTALGNSLMEAVSFLNNPKNNQVYLTLKAQMKITV